METTGYSDPRSVERCLRHASEAERLANQVVSVGMKVAFADEAAQWWALAQQRQTRSHNPRCKRFGDRAEELRAIAETMRDPSCREMLLRLAANYEKIARWGADRDN